MYLSAASHGAAQVAAEAAVTAAREERESFYATGSGSASARGASLHSSRGGSPSGSPPDAWPRAASAAGDEGATPGEAAAREWAHLAAAALVAGRLARLRRSGGDAEAPSPQRSPSPSPHAREGGSGASPCSDEGGAEPAEPASPATPPPHAPRAPSDAGGASPYTQSLVRSRFAFFPDDGLSLRARVHLTLDNPSYSPWAFAFSMVALSVVLLSCIGFVIETLEHLQDEVSQRRFDSIELFCIVFFTVEYGGRILTSPEPLRFARRPGNLADLAAILPYYVEQGMRAHGDAGGDGDFGRARLVRIVRLVRIFRLLKMGTRNDKLRVVVAALRESADMLVVLLFLLVIATVIFSTLMFFAEEGRVRPPRPGEPPRGVQFASIPGAFWWCIVTLMTVGYGDVVPVSDEGKLVAGLTMVAAFIILALPISVIGANFTQQWIMYKETTLLHRRTGRLGDDFSALKAELEVHTSVLAEIADVAAARASAMDTRLRRLRCTASQAGLTQPQGTAEDAPDASPPGARAHAPHDPSPPPSPRGGASHDSSPASPPVARLSTSSLRLARPRNALCAAERELETLLEALARDADAAAETFAMAELISSEDFLTRMDGATTKHHRMAVMDKKGTEACSAVQTLLASLAAERAARPSLVTHAAQTEMPTLAAAAAAAAALLASGGGSTRGGGSATALAGGGTARLRHVSSASSSLPRNDSGLSAVSLATQASRDALDKLAAARSISSVDLAAQAGAANRE